MPSLRSKLVAAFVLVIFICLLLASSAFVFMLRDYQTQLKLNQLVDLAVPVSLQVRMLERLGASPEQIAFFLAEQAREMNVRVLLVDPQGTIIEDTHGELEGLQVELPDQPYWRSRRTANFAAYQGPHNLFLVVTSPRASSQFPERFVSRAPSYSVVLAVPQQSVTSAWLELAPSLSIAAFVSLIVSVGIALLLSRSISRPLAQITRASEEMAQGNYEQNIPIRGRDEIGRLASAFNGMASQVSLSHRTLRDFLANVSHELKTPLTSIQGFSQAMVDGTINDAAGYLEAGEIINGEAERMRHLVEDLLYLSKIESGQIKIESQHVDLDNQLRACLRKFERRASECGVTLSLEAARAPSVRGDAYKLEQVFNNLLDNAVKYTPAGGKVTVVADPVPANSAGRQHSTVNGANGGGQGAATGARIRVHNTGSTIPPEDLDKVFERFYQVDKSRVKSSDGSGLGLAIAKEIVLAHGGTVEVKSSPEEGTEFVVTLPLSRS
ncbi:MAG: HAMP domain-containing histidine kinase [Chloroflexi bacterium]|nr:HAMP domain-containing histidine kinase [Chloroflexota bacterium]